MLRIWVQVAYLRNEPKNQSEKKRKVRPGRRKIQYQNVFEVTYVSNGGLIQGISEKCQACFPVLCI